MLILRSTKALRQRIGPTTLRTGEQSTTLLGDWYATALPWRHQVALLVNEATLLPVLMPLAPAATMPARAGDAIANTLRAHGTEPTFIDVEREHMRVVRIAPTANRSVVGIMNEFTALADAWRDTVRPDLLELATRLSRVPCGPLYKRQTFPDRELATIHATTQPR